MKKASILLFACISTSGILVQAETLIGDLTLYKGQTVSSGQIVPYSITYSVASFNSAADTFHVESTIQYDSYVSYHSRDTLKSEMVTEEMAAEIVKNCETSEGGILETVTVKAGTFLACKKPRPDFPNLINWYAPVPVRGVVKFIYTEGGDRVTTAELVSYSKGKPAESLLNQATHY